MLISPVTDMSCSGNSVTENKHLDDIIKAPLLQMCVDAVLQGHPATDPRVSPLFGSFEGFPRFHGSLTLCTAHHIPCTASPAYLMVHFSLISSHCTSSPGYLTLNISLLTSHSSLQPLHISLCASHCAHLTVLIISRCLSHSATPSTDILYTSHSHMQVACLCCPSLTRCSTQAVCDGS